MVKFNICCQLFYRQLLEVLPPDPQKFSFFTPLETSVPRHSETSTLLTLLDSGIIAWGSVSDLDTYLGFRCSKKG